MLGEDVAKGEMRKRFFRIFLRLLFIIPGKGTIRRIPGVRKTYVWLFRFIPCKIMVEVQGRKMYIRPADAGTERDLFMYKIFEPGHTRLFQEIIRTGMTVVDIGAHIGYFTLYRRKACRS